MAEKLNYLKAVEFDKLSASFRKRYPDISYLAEENQEGLRWLWQPKYDGCYVRVNLRTGKAFSRTGEAVPHLSLTATELSYLYRFTDYKWLIGEAWSASMQFPEISGIFRTKDVGKVPIDKRLFIAAHDLLMDDEDPRPYEYRLKSLSRTLDDFQPLYVICPTYPQYLRLGTNYKSLAAEYVSRGHYDGLVIKDGTAPYTCGLAKEGQIIKVKPSFSLDLRVATIITEFGEKTGRKVYTLQIRHEGKGRGHSFVGSGMPHILPPDLTVGCIVEVEFMGWTEDGHLREPRFKGVRHDKVEADYE